MSRKWTFAEKRDRGLDFLRFLKTENVDVAGLTKDEIRFYYAGSYKSYRQQIAPDQQHLPFSVILQTLFVIGRLHLRGIHVYHGPAPGKFFNSNQSGKENSPSPQPSPRASLSKSSQSSASTASPRSPYRPSAIKIHHKIAVDQHIIYNKPNDNAELSRQPASSPAQAAAPDKLVIPDRKNKDEIFIKKVGNYYECIACTAKCTSAGELERHRDGRRHRLGVISYQLRGHRDFFVKNKDDLEIRSPYSSGQGVVAIDLEENKPKTIALEIINTSKTENRELLHCEMLKRLRVFQLDDDLKVTESQSTAIIPPGCSYKVRVKAEARNVGTFHVPIAFHFRIHGTTTSDTHIIRYLQAKCKNQMIDNLQPTSKYKRPPRVARNFEAVEIVRGYKIPRSAADGLEKVINLKMYNIEDTVRKMINRGFKDTKNSTQAEKLELSSLRRLMETPVTMDTYVKKFATLLNVEEVQMEVDIRKYDMEAVTLSVCRENKKLLLLEVPGLAENRPSVLRGDWLYVRINNKGKLGEKEYEGFVHEVREKEVALGFNDSLNSIYVQNMRFNVRFVFNRLPLKLQHRACELAPEESLQEILFPMPDTVCTMGSSSTSKLGFLSKDVEKNKEQRIAVEHIVRGTSRPAPYIVFGPPGTGKTVTIVEAMKQIYRNNKDSHILACTPSNSAADLLVERLLTHVSKNSIIRLNALSRAWKTVPDKVKEVSNINKSDGSYYFPPKSILSRYRIIVCTLVTAGRIVSANFPSGHFTHVFIDEAGHAVEPECLIAVAGVLTVDPDIQSCGQLVLAGDPKQLGPILRSPFAIQYGLDVSLLERYMTECNVYQRRTDKNVTPYDNRIITKLLQNYRSHPAILTLPNQLFYDSELTPCADEMMRTCLCDWEKLPRKNFPVVFHGVIGQDMREERSPSFFNAEEATVVFNYVSSLLKEKKTGVRISPQNIGIISPYRKQVQKIQGLMRQQKWDKIQVGSVEEFQGQERQVIIVSTVRSNPEYLSLDMTYKLGFLKNPKRFNVTLTRAQALMIVVGNPYTLSQDKNWKSFINYCIDNNSYIGVEFTREEDLLDDIIQRLEEVHLGNPALLVKDQLNGTEEEDGDVPSSYLKEVSKYNEQAWRADI